MEVLQYPPTDLPPELIEYARLQAVKDAERVSLFLEQQGVPKDRPLLLEHARLLATALRFREWDAADIDLHVKHALPAAADLLAFGERELGHLAPDLIQTVTVAKEDHGADLDGLQQFLSKIPQERIDPIRAALAALNTTYNEVPSKAVALTLEHFAWSGPELLGAEVLISQPAPGDLDALVETLAEVFVQHRHLLRTHNLEDDCHEQTC